MLLFDAHAHVNFSAFREDGEEVIKRALREKVWLINVGSQYSTSKRAVEYAQRHSEGVFAAVGLHPAHLKPQKIKEDIDSLEEFEFETSAEEFEYEKYKKLASQPKVVAIGEVGLDYYHLSAEPRGTNTRNNVETIEGQKNKQKENFIKHLEIAKELNKPVIVHCREAHNDVLEILKNFYKEKPSTSLAESRRAGSGNKNVLLSGQGDEVAVSKGGLCRGVVHSFSGRWSQAEEYFNFGFYIGFNGLVTFARDYDKVIKNAPLERILLETDCPYLTPEPHRGKRNEPAYVKYVAEKIAEIKEVSFEEVAKITTENARRLFKI